MMDRQIVDIYESMRKESNRLRSFQMNPPWPKDYVDIKKLAKAGFFYAFNGDQVQCAFCHGQVARWERDDDPMSEHARHFTTCPFIMGGEVGNEPLGEDPFPGPKRPRPYDVCGMYSAVPPNPAFVWEPNTDTISAQQQQQLPPPPPQHQNQHQHQHQLPPQLQLLPPQQPIPPPPQQQQLTQHEPPPPPMYQDNRQGNLIGICKICYTNSIELVFLPCGHSISCLSCAQRLYSCPYCRATITTRIRAYFV